MPASLLYELDNASNILATSCNGLEDRRAFELALELSKLGLGTSNENVHSIFQHSTNNHVTNSHTLSTAHSAHPFEHESRFITKRSQNTTECVPVPSSEHVAEIVGRQGCKIKALRAKTNTYIKTPVRGEEPVFVVTGRKEDVSAAKREILSAAEHFSQIRAQRKNNPGSVGPAPNAHLPGHITIQVKVPYRVVGLVVGPKGATIKRIQQQTNTYIITPSRDKDPVFEVTGLPDDVETARKEIEAHIAIRTGGIIDSHTGSIGSPDESTSDFSNSPLLSSLDNPFSSTVSLSGNSLFKSSDPFCSFTSNFGAKNNGTSSATSMITSNSPSDIFSGATSNRVTRKFSSDFCSLFGSSNGLTFSNGSGSNSGKNTSQGSYDTDEGIGDSPTYDILHRGSNSSSLWSEVMTTNRNISNTNNSTTAAAVIGTSTQRSSFLLNGLTTTATTIGNGLEQSLALDYHRRSSSLESSINSSSNSSASSSYVSCSAPASASFI